MDRSEPSDDDLMNQCRKGDCRAMDALVSRYHRRVYNFSYQMLHQREAAEDAAQETFLRAYRNAGRYKAGGRFSNWLFAIAANLCRTELRKRARHREAAWDELGEVESAVSVERAAMSRLECAEVKAAMERLSPDHRMALVLFYFEGMSQQDISQVCGCSLGTVKSRLHYALARLRGMLPAPPQPAGAHPAGIPAAARGGR